MTKQEILNSVEEIRLGIAQHSYDTVWVSNFETADDALTSLKERIKGNYNPEDQFTIPFESKKETDWWSIALILALLTYNLATLGGAFYLVLERDWSGLTFIWPLILASWPERKWKKPEEKSA